MSDESKNTIRSDIRARINERLYTSRLCIEYLGVPNPSPGQIAAWVETWPAENMVMISNYKRVESLLAEQEIPRLLYHLGWHFNTDSGILEKVVRFYRNEDLVIFKLMYNKI